MTFPVETVDLTKRYGRLSLELEADKAAWLNSELVSAGLAVSELRTSERDLEQVFFELTGEEADHVG
jgi:ABC-2 type transport system ATP-binding protein